MNLNRLFEARTPQLSLEIFPPKKNKSGIDTIYETLDGIQGVKPAFISVTYGAAGSLADNSTCDICEIIKNKYGITPMAHLTCVNNTREDIDVILSRLKAAGVSNILALRGDYRPDVAPKEDFKHASDLITYIKEKDASFFISGACYPEGHPESNSSVDDILNLKKKVECGAEHLISQLFFDNEDFYTFREKCAIAGIDVPIEAGIMPVTSKKGLMRMVSTCGASVPKKLARVLNKFENNPKAFEDACVAYAIDQIIDLITNDVDGIHLYAMNKPHIVNRVYGAVESMR